MLLGQAVSAGGDIKMHIRSFPPTAGEGALLWMGKAPNKPTQQANGFASEASAAD